MKALHYGFMMQLLNKMKLCLVTTRHLNTAIISKDECQRHDLARRVVPRGGNAELTGNITFIDRETFFVATLMPSIFCPVSSHKQGFHICPLAQRGTCHLSLWPCVHTL
jgi:hypothetical protein